MFCVWHGHFRLKLVSRNYHLYVSELDLIISSSSYSILELSQGLEDYNYKFNTLRTKNEYSRTKENSPKDQKRKYACSKLNIEFEIESGQI